MNHFLVTLYTRERNAYFRQYPHLKEVAEQVWRQVIGVSSGLHSDTYAVNGSAFYAILRISENAPDLALTQALADYRYMCVQEWGSRLGEDSPISAGDIWSASHRTRPLDTPEKLKDAEAFMVQLMIK